MSVPVYDIGLGSWKATSIDYSIPTADSCYVCRSYWEIDDFASRVSLPSIGKLSVRPAGLPPPNIKKVSDGLIDGQELLRSMIEMDIQVNGSVANNNANILNVDNSSKGMFQRLAGEEKMNSKSYKTAKINFKTITEIEWGAKIPNEPLNIEYYRQNYKQLRLDWCKETLAWDKRSQKGEEAIKGFAKQLWLAFKAARKGPVDTESDNVLKARLIFTWLATSFSYDHKLAAEDDDGDWPLIKNFVTGQAICSGFAGLFVLMFNAIVKAEESQAYSLLGYVRILGGNPPSNMDDWGHAWAAFPLEPKHGEYQLLDVTWAVNDFSKGAKNVKHVQWWSKPNVSFNWCHIYDADYHKHWNATIPPYTTIGGPFPDRWNRAQPVFVYHQDDFLHFIDKDSLSQKDLVIAENNGKIVVNFKNPCQHQKRLDPPQFYLVAASKAENPQFSKPRATFESRPDGFWSAAFLVKVLTNMAYIAICVQKNKEYRPVVLWLRVGQDIPKKYTKYPPDPE